MITRHCHPERSEGSLCPSRQTLRGVYPERSEGLRVTLGDSSNGQGLFFTIEPCLTLGIVPPLLKPDAIFGVFHTGLFHAFDEAQSHSMPSEDYLATRLTYHLCV